MKKHTSSGSHVVTWKRVSALFLLAAVASCGGGGGDDTPTPPAAAPAPAPAASMPSVVDAGSVQDSHQVGTTFFPSGPTATGGTGNPVGGVNCGTADQTVAYFAHLSIFMNGQMLTIPDRVGIVRDAAGNLTCVYTVHTHTGDLSGRIHKEGPDQTVYTLGNFFSVWGMPLTTTNVAGITSAPLTAVYIVDGGVVTQFTGDPATIQLTSHRHIALVLGTPITQLPVYSWN